VPPCSVSGRFPSGWHSAPNPAGNPTPTRSPVDDHGIVFLLPCRPGALYMWCQTSSRGLQTFCSPRNLARIISSHSRSAVPARPSGGRHRAAGMERLPSSPSKSEWERPRPPIPESSALQAHPPAEFAALLQPVPWPGHISPEIGPFPRCAGNSVPSDGRWTSSDRPRHHQLRCESRRGLRPSPSISLSELRSGTDGRRGLEPDASTPRIPCANSCSLSRFRRW